MSSAEKIKKLFAKSDVTVNSKIDDRIISNALTALEKSEKTQSVSPEPNIWRIIMKSRITKLAAAAVIFIAILIVVNQFGGSLDGASVAWADVAERFRSVPFFSATLYMKDNATAQPEQVELWMNQAGRSRLRIGNQITFAQGGKITKTFDLKTRSETEPDYKVVALMDLMGDEGSFSLDTVIRGISGGELVDVTPLVNTDAVISEDLVVFDVESRNSTQWFRIWALRASKLPVRIRMWDPIDGACADILLTYSKEQQEIFFDPEAFSAKMKRLPDKKINLAYMFLKDPGGKQIFPGSLNESEAFRVVTQTIDGESWSLAEHRGKIVLINFWTRRDRPKWETWLKDVHKRFKGRDDFIMVGVSLRKDAESTKEICTKKGIPWLQLHEPGKELKNSLARAFGIDDTYGGWLVWKNGRIDRLGSAMNLDTGKVEGAVLGLTYDSQMWIFQVLNKDKRAGILTRETVEQICGKPHSVSKTDSGWRWDYTLFNKDKTAVRNFNIDFDEAGNCLRWGSGYKILNPAVVTISFSSEYLKEHVEDQVEPEIRARLYEDHLVTISAQSGNTGYPLSDRESIQPEQSYTRRLYPGTYNFVVRIWASSEIGKCIKTITLLKDVKLAKDEKKTIRFE